MLPTCVHRVDLLRRGISTAKPGLGDYEIWVGSDEKWVKYREVSLSVLNYDLAD